MLLLLPAGIRAEPLRTAERADGEERARGLVAALLQQSGFCERLRQGKFLAMGAAPRVWRRRLCVGACRALLFFNPFAGKEVGMAIRALREKPSGVWRAWGKQTAVDGVLGLLLLDVLCQSNALEHLLPISTEPQDGVTSAPRRSLLHYTVDVERDACVVVRRVQKFEHVLCTLRLRWIDNK